MLCLDLGTRSDARVYDIVAGLTELMPYNTQHNIIPRRTCCSVHPCWLSSIKSAFFFFNGNVIVGGWMPVLGETGRPADKALLVGKKQNKKQLPNQYSRHAFPNRKICCSSRRSCFVKRGPFFVWPPYCCISFVCLFLYVRVSLSRALGCAGVFFIVVYRSMDSIVS